MWQLAGGFACLYRELIEDILAREASL